MELTTWQAAQEAEYRWHSANEFRKGDAFAAESADLFRAWGFGPDDYAGKTVIDVGAGSRLRSRYFNGAQIVAIEPLWVRFIHLEWCDLGEAQVYAVPAEKYIRTLEKSADLLVCINVLDHCYDIRAIITNIERYTKGIAVISFDVYGAYNEMHPLVLTEEAVRSALDWNGLEIISQYTGAAYGAAAHSVTYKVKPL